MAFSHFFLLDRRIGIKPPALKKLSLIYWKERLPTSESCSGRARFAATQEGRGQASAGLISLFCCSGHCIRLDQAYVSP